MAAGLCIDEDVDEHMHATKQKPVPHKGNQLLFQQSGVTDIIKQRLEQQQAQPGRLAREDGSRPFARALEMLQSTGSHDPAECCVC